MRAPNPLPRAAWPAVAATAAMLWLVAAPGPAQARPVGPQTSPLAVSRTLTASVKASATTRTPTTRTATTRTLAPKAYAPKVTTTKADPTTLFPTGPFRQRVDTMALDPRNTAYVERMSTANLVISLRRWTVPVYGATSTTPLSKVALTQTWGTGITLFNGLPLPSGARPDPEADGHLTVVKQSNDCVYDLYRARTTSTGWAANWANATPMSGSGIYTDGGGTRAAGFSGALGLVWPQEIERGRIDHALVFGYPFTRSGLPVPPATRSDGRTDAADALPMGARVRLDPKLDLSTLKLTKAEQVVAKALQEYGMVLGDTSGGFTLYAAHPYGLGSDPYAGMFDTGSDWASLAKLPKNRFQVVTLPPTVSRKTAPQSACSALR